MSPLCTVNLVEGNEQELSSYCSNSLWPWPMCVCVMCRVQNFSFQPWPQCAEMTKSSNDEHRGPVGSVMCLSIVMDILVHEFYHPTLLQVLCVHYAVICYFTTAERVCLNSECSFM
jgi:hypothetical protein